MSQATAGRTLRQHVGSGSRARCRTLPSAPQPGAGLDRMLIGHEERRAPAGPREEAGRELEPAAVVTYSMPRRILFGIGSLEALSAEVTRLGGTRLLLVTDRGIARAGLLDRVLQELQPGDFRLDVFDAVEPDPGLAVVEACRVRLRAGRHDLVIGLGGGSPLDVAKYAAALVVHPGSAQDYLGMDLLTAHGVPTLLIPTTAGSGSEVTRAAVFHDETESVKKAAWSDRLLTDVAIVDPSLMLSQPPELTADAGMDALVHAVEAYAATGASPLSDLLALEAIRLIGGSLLRSFRKGADLFARSEMARAAMLAGLACSNAGLGAAHALALLLNTEFGLTHGRSVAVLLPHVVGFNLPARASRYAQVGRALGGPRHEGKAAMAEALGARLSRLLHELEIPTSIRHYGLEAGRLREYSERAHRTGQRLLSMNPRAVTVTDAVRIYEQAF